MRCDWTEPETLSDGLGVTCKRCGAKATIMFHALGRHPVESAALQHALAHIPDCGELTEDHKKPACGEAQQQQATFPGPIKRVGRWGRAVARWRKAGQPTRSEKEVSHLYVTHCNPPERPCPYFVPDRQSCRLCGCKVRRTGSAFLNKLAMGTERCPDNPPQWVEMPGYEQEVTEAKP